MSKRNNQDQKADLALALATGSTVKAWAESRNVADRTARTWSKSPEVLHQVEAIRRQAIECAIGRLSDRASAAADRIGHLAIQAASEAVQLHAARAVLADLMSMSDYATFEKRLADVERRIAHAQPDPQQGASHRLG
jgi:hypothetical protein